ncbi:hypothetical protein C8R45DRAFT_937147 [Mycena sanguinolenta]|nr:hypothetical protein C8R45DRAFT_937147 [Mycena sanguinolenta]
MLLSKTFDLKLGGREVWPWRMMMRGSKVEYLEEERRRKAVQAHGSSAQADRQRMWHIERAKADSDGFQDYPLVILDICPVDAQMFINATIRADAVNDLLLRTEMRQSDIKVIREAGGGSDSASAMSLHAKIAREHIYSSIYKKQKSVDSGVGNQSRLKVSVLLLLHVHRPYLIHEFLVAGRQLPQYFPGCKNPRRFRDRGEHRHEMSSQSPKTPPLWTKEKVHAREFTLPNENIGRVEHLAGSRRSAPASPVLDIFANFVFGRVPRFDLGLDHYLSSSCWFSIGEFLLPIQRSRKRERRIDRSVHLRVHGVKLALQWTVKESATTRWWEETKAKCDVGDFHSSYSLDLSAYSCSQKGEIKEANNGLV